MNKTVCGVLTNIAVSFCFVVSSESSFPPPVNAMPSIPIVEMVNNGYIISLHIQDFEKSKLTIATTIDQSSGPQAFLERRT